MEGVSKKKGKVRFAYFTFFSDHGGIWTHTPLRAPPPQDGKSTVSPRGQKLKKVK